MNEDNRTPGWKAISSIIGTWMFIGVLVWLWSSNGQVSNHNLVIAAIAWSIGDLLSVPVIYLIRGTDRRNQRRR